MVDEEELLEASQASWQDKLDQEEEEEDLDVEEEVLETEEDSVVEVSFYLNHLASFHLEAPQNFPLFNKEAATLQKIHHLH